MADEEAAVTGEPAAVGEPGFRALELRDLPQLHAWLAEPHVAAWWGPPPTFESVRDEYGPTVTGAEPTDCYIVVLGARDVGMIQAYSWDAYQKEGAALDTRAGEWGVDYLIGDPGLIGRGLGSAMLRGFVFERVLASPAVTGIRTSVAVGNRASWRCLEKLGFKRDGPRLIPDEQGPQYVLSLARR